MCAKKVQAGGCPFLNSFTMFSLKAGVSSYLCTVVPCWTTASISSSTLSADIATEHFLSPCGQSLQSIYQRDMTDAPLGFRLVFRKMNLGGHMIRVTTFAGVASRNNLRSYSNLRHFTLYVRSWLQSKNLVSYGNPSIVGQIPALPTL